jgi:hypothetical protein
LGDPQCTLITFTGCSWNTNKLYGMNIQAGNYVNITGGIFLNNNTLHGTGANLHIGGTSLNTAVTEVLFNSGGPFATVPWHIELADSTDYIQIGPCSYQGATSGDINEVTSGTHLSVYPGITDRTSGNWSQIGASNWPVTIGGQLTGGTINNMTIGSLTGPAADFSLDVDFLHGVLDSRVTVARASIGTYFDSTGTLQTASNNVARFDYDPVTLQPRGILIEETRTNFLLNSGAPATQTTASLASGTYVLWVVGSGSATSSAGTAVGTGFGAAIAGTFNSFVVTTAGTVTVTVTGTLTRFQLEKTGAAAGVFATSYIPTTATVVARAADAVSATVTGWINTTTTSGTLMAEGLKATPLNVIAALIWVYKSANDKCGVYINSTTLMSAQSQIAGASTFTNTSVAEPIGIPYRFAMAYSDGAQASCLNGGAVFPAAAATIASGWTSLQIGSTVGVQCFNGWIRRVRYWPRMLSNTELTQVTTSSSITGTTIDSTPIGDTTPSRGTFTNLRVNGNVGFYNTVAVAKPTVSGAKGSNTALGSLIAALVSQGLIADTTTA